MKFPKQQAMLTLSPPYGTSTKQAAVQRAITALTKIYHGLISQAKKLMKQKGSLSY
jgi:tRNA1(Val) A37 N6-methylase TrmN6